jgi:3-oxoacyl-[acyl-carrier protein] reductase
MSISFAGKTALITGAAGAIGAQCAHLLASLGARLVLTDASSDALLLARKGLPPSTDVAVSSAIDVTDSQQVADLREEINLLAGPIDAMVLSAGIYRPSRLAEMSDQEWLETINVNLTGVFNFLRAFGPRMRAGGSIVALSSIAQRGSDSFAHYAASKAGLLGLIRSAAIEFAPHCRVNALSPGPIDSPMVQPLIERRGPEIIAQTPLRRLGTPLDVAQAVAFLVSDWSSYITGENLQVNGGLYMA